MSAAIVRLIVSALVVATIAGVLAVLLALAVAGDFHEKLQLTLWLAAGMLLVFAAVGSSPSMDRAIGQRARMMVGPVMGQAPESHDGPRPTTSAVLVLAALFLFAASVVAGG